MEIFGGNAASDEYHIGRIAANLWVAQTCKLHLPATLATVKQ